MEGGVTMREAGWDQDSDVVSVDEPNAPDGAPPLSPQTQSYAYYGGACQCRTSPTQPTGSSSPWLPVVCTTLALALVDRKRKYR